MSDTDMLELTRAVRSARRQSLIMLTASSAGAILIVSIAGLMLASA
ncbi:hypothetical protein [Devosia pacifica]|nr:hypothetical protein [Devosia pacifica]